MSDKLSAASCGCKIGPSMQGVFIDASACQYDRLKAELQEARGKLQQFKPIHIPDVYRLSAADLDRLINEIKPATDLSDAIKDLLLAHYELDTDRKLAAQLQAANARADGAETIAGDAHAEIERLVARVVELERALRDAEDYAQHERGCPFSDTDCSCGYQAWWDRKEKALSPTAAPRYPWHPTEDDFRQLAPATGYFTSKAITIQAGQFTLENKDRIFNWIGSNKAVGHNEDGTPYLAIQTLEGVMTADLGDWIIKGTRGEFYPCKPDVFALKYKPTAAPTELPTIKEMSGSIDFGAAPTEEEEK